LLKKYKKALDVLKSMYYNEIMLNGEQEKQGEKNGLLQTYTGT
jgi:hypothetical protein